MDSNRDNVLTRSEMKQALADRAIVLRDEQLTHLMAFLDVQGRGYITLGDLHDSLRSFRAVHLRQAIAPPCPPRLSRPQPRQQRHSTATSRLQSALLAPLVLFTTPPPVEGSAKRRRCTTKASKKRILEQEAGISHLDITDPEVRSLVDYLMDVGNGADNEDIGHAKGKFHSNFDGCSSSIDAGQSQLRPLPLVMAALESAASQVTGSSNPKGGHGEDVRGPGPAAVPSSAARVLRILRSLQKVWRQKDRRRRENALTQRDPGEFSDEKLSAAVNLLDIDGKGHIDLEDVITVFRNVRAGTFVRRRPPSAALPSLAVLGRYLDNRGITARDFVQEAAISSVPVVDPLKSGGQPGDVKSSPTVSRASIRTKDRPATTAQLAARLCAETELSAEQRALVLACIEDNGFVSAADLAGAVRRAKGELAHRKLERMERQRGAVGGGGGGYGSKKQESQGPEASITESGCSIASLARCRQPAGLAAGDNTGGPVPLQQNHRCRRDEPVPRQDTFNQSDASLILDLFVKEGGGLRSLTGETAVALWRGLKRRSRGLHAYEAGRSASRHLRRLLRDRGKKPLQWFRTLESLSEGPAEGGESATVPRRVAISSIFHGVGALIEMPPLNPLGELNTTDAATAVATSGDDDSAADSAAASLEGSLSNSDGSVEQTFENADKEMKWTRAQLSALARHLDPCGDGSITQEVFREGLSDSRVDRVCYPDAVQLAAARRFEAALRDVGYSDICGLFLTLAGSARGGGELIQYIRHMGDCFARSASRDLDAEARQERVARAIAMRESVSWYLADRVVRTAIGSPALLFVYDALVILITIVLRR